MEKIYQPKSGMKFNFFARRFVMAAVVIAAIIRGTPLRELHMSYKIIAGVILSASVAAFMVSKINYEFKINGPFIEINNKSFKNDYAKIDARNFFIHGNVKGTIGAKYLNFTEIGVSGPVYRYDLRLALSELEFIELIRELELLKREKVQSQLNIAEEEIIENTSSFKRTFVSIIGHSLIIPIAAILIDMLLKNKIGTKIFPLLVLIFTIFAARGFKGLYDRSKNRVKKIKIDKNNLEITTPNRIYEYKFKDIKEIALSHPASYGPEEKLIRIVKDDKANIYYYGDQNYTSLDYERLFAKLTENKKKKIGIFY